MLPCCFCSAKNNFLKMKKINSHFFFHFCTLLEPVAAPRDALRHSGDGPSSRSSARGESCANVHVEGRKCNLFLNYASKYLEKSPPGEIKPVHSGFVASGTFPRSSAGAQWTEQEFVNGEWCCTFNGAFQHLHGAAKSAFAKKKEKKESSLSLARSPTRIHTPTAVRNARRVWRDWSERTQEHFEQNTV